MHPNEIADTLKAIGFMSSPELDTLSRRWSQAPDSLVKAVLGMLKEFSTLEGIKFRTYKHDYVSAYGLNRIRRWRECFHIGILRLDPKLVVYQFGDAKDPQNFFTDQQESRPNARHGYLLEGALNRIPYIQGVLRQSYLNLTQH